MSERASAWGWLSSGDGPGLQNRCVAVGPAQVCSTHIHPRLKQDVTAGRMQEALTIYVPEEVRLMLNRTKEELSRDIRLNSALMFFWLGKLSSGAAAELAGVPRVMFLDLCHEYGIPVSQISAADLTRELEDD